MRRVMVMLILLLGLGLGTSLLVAWAGALVDRTNWPDTILTRGPTGSRTEIRGWLVEEGRDRTLTWRTFNALDLWDEPPDLEAPTELPGWSVGHGLADQPGPFAPARERTRDVAWEVSAGWPMRCVRAVRGAGPEEFALPGEFVRGGVAAMAYEWPIPHATVPSHQRPMVSAWRAEWRATIVPLRPMPLGLLVNTVVFALAWFVALFPLALLRPLRRRRRAKRNRCVRCGHAREGLPAGAPCPECGHNPSVRTRVGELLSARAPMLGAAMALALVLVGVVALPTHRWMAVDRLPPLHHAAAEGDVEEVERLLTEGTPVGGAMGRLAGLPGWLDDATALHWAAARGHDAVAQRLLAAGAPAGARPYGGGPLSLAMGARHDLVAERLIAHLPAADTPSDLELVLPHASEAVRDRVLAHFALTDVHVERGVEGAIASNDLACARALIDRASAMGIRWTTDAMKTAVRTDARAWGPPYRRDLGLTGRVLALDLPAPPDIAQQAAWVAIVTGCVPAFDTLLSAYPSIDADDLDLHGDELAQAAIRGGRPMLARLVELGVNVNALGRQGFNALLPAAMAADADAMAILLAAGVDPTHEDGGVTLRRWLLAAAERAEKDPRDNPRFPSLIDPAAFGRMMEMLEAAEAEWNARAQDPAPPGPP
jgi:hypothetical protein